MKIGDKVKVKNYGNFPYIHDGSEGKIIAYAIIDNNGSLFDYSYLRPNYYNGYLVSFEYYANSISFFNNQLELINNLDKPMNLKEKFLTSLKKEPEKSFRKAEITNGDDLLTEVGKDVFLYWLLQKNGAEFKKEVVDDILKEEEKD